MRTSSGRFLQLGSLACFLGACGSSGGLPGVVPSVSITSPADNSTVNLSADKKVAINFETNYTLRAPGTCGTQDNCGHIYVMVDSSTCNAPNMVFNTIAVSSPVEADLSKCMTPTGMHTITLDLRHDNGTSVQNLLDNPVTSMVTITAQ